MVQLVGKFGIRTVFTFLGLLSAVATFSLPTAIYNGLYWTLGARVVQGYSTFTELIQSFCNTGKVLTSLIMFVTLIWLF